MYRQYTPTLKSTIGNDLTGTIQGGDQNDKLASGVFSYQIQTNSALGGDVFKLDLVRFSGSSGTYNLLYLKPKDIKGGNHSHSRGTIGNDLTGTIKSRGLMFVDLSSTRVSGVFSYSKDSLIHPAGENYGGNAELRFSGSSGFTGSVLEWPALYSQPCHLRSHSLATAEAR